MAVNLSRAPTGTRYPNIEPPEPIALPLAITSKHGQSYNRRRAQIVQLLVLGVTMRDIASRVGVSTSFVYKTHRNIMMYGSPLPPRFRTLGRPKKLTWEDKNALFSELVEHGWVHQDEMVYWLEAERNVHVSQSTVSRMLKKEGWNTKTLRLISLNRCEDLRDDYRQTIAQYNSDDLVFIDESMFNEKTGWRHRAYGPIGEENRWVGDAQRGTSWSILPAYTLQHGYLSCTGIKEGYYNLETFLEWIEQQLLPAINHQMGGRAVCIVLDNCSTHCNIAVREAIERAGHTLQYLPPYSPDYNPIELTFSVLKAWVRRHFYYRRHQFERFGDFLQWAIEESSCDRFSAEHFRHAGGGGLYIDSEAHIIAMEQLRAYEAGELELLQF